MERETEMETKDSKVDPFTLSYFLHQDTLYLDYKQSPIFLKADLHGTTLPHATSLRQANDTNCFV